MIMPLRCTAANMARIGYVLVSAQKQGSHNSIYMYVCMYVVDLCTVALNYILAKVN